MSAQCPLYPRKRTFANAIVMSALCQKKLDRNGSEKGRVPFSRTWNATDEARLSKTVASRAPLAASESEAQSSYSAETSLPV